MFGLTGMRCTQSNAAGVVARVGLALLLSFSTRAHATELRVQLSAGEAQVDMSEAVVSLHSSAPHPTPTGGGRAVMDQRASSFLPRILPVRVGTRVSFPNSDRIRHQVYSFSEAKPFELPLYAGAEAPPVDFDKPGVVVVGCNIHDSMIGYVVVLDTPHFVRAGQDGTAQLDAPPGVYRLQVWHPRLAGPALQRSITLEAGKAQRLPVAIGVRVTAKGQSPNRVRALQDKFRRLRPAP